MPCFLLFALTHWGSSSKSEPWAPLTDCCASSTFRAPEIEKKSLCAVFEKVVTLHCVRKSRHSALCSKKSSLYAVLKKNSSLCAFRNSRHCAHFKKGVLNRVCPFGRNLKNKEWQEWVATSDSERSSTAWESIEVNTWKVSAYLLIKTWFFGPTRALLFYHMGGPRLWKWYFSLQLATSNHT